MEGNPVQLTNCQHVFPTASIKRFADLNGLVSVALRTTKKQFKAKPEDDIFCAFCVWDYRAESGYMVDIENQFQALAAEILANNVVSLNADQCRTVTRFWALWSLRAGLRNEPEPDRPVHGVAGEHLTNEQRDRVESLGGTFILSSGNVGGFVVPDSPANMLAVPLTPEIGLCFEHDNCLIPESEVARTNRCSLKLAKRYYFARDFSACPGIAD